mgnify:FL=1
MVSVSVNEETCIGCGACVALAPQIFELDMEKMKSKVKKQPENDEEKELAKQAAEACPVGAITVQ